MNKNRWRNREMLTIGQMSKICGVSVKTLRHYEKIGLLRPRKTDEANGYRYYEDSQISTMLLIGRLKRYGFSLTDIQGLLDTKDAGSLLGQLRKQKFRLEQQMNYLSVTVREMGIHLEEFERTGDIMSYQNNYEIQVKETEEQVLVTSRQKMSVEEFGNYYGKLYEKIAREHLTANGITMAIYHDQEFDPAYSDIELAVGITERDKADCIMPKRFCAATVHKGAYSGLPDAYGAIVSWINANGYRPDGMPYEIYVKNHFHNLPPEEWETEIFFPVKK
nr:MerR family transcriptional regulator [Enterocloster citroniae]